MMNENNKHTWCVNAFHSMSANNDGSTKMCCMSRKSYNDLQNNSADFYIGKKTIEENFNNSTAKKIRSNLENGIKDNACRLCWQEEDGGRKSKRMRDNEKYFHEIKWNNKQPFTGLAKFELNLGNTCNIKCRTCHASISSQWLKEDYDLNKSQQMTFKAYSDTMKKYHQCYDEDSPFWPDLVNNLSTIKQFDFYGGEPFLSKKMWEVLKICVDEGYSKDIALHYNTNGTTWPKEIEIWKNFKSVNLSFSIDGIGDQFEYMRFLAEWEEVKKNMSKAVAFKKEHGVLDLSWCVTLSSLNTYYLPEILDTYYKEFTDFGLYLNLVHAPEIFNVSLMHPTLKEKVVARLEKIPREYSSAWSYLPGIIGFIKSGNGNPTLWSTLLQTIKTHDNYRGQDYFKTFKEFGDIINDIVLE